MGLRRITEPTVDYRQNSAFFEAYFSNFIEGTEFLVEEAEDIVFNGRIMPTRTGDSHDILGTFQVVVDPTEMSRVPTTDDEFLDILCRRHQTMLSHSPEKTPGQFKSSENRVGTYPFVRPELVEGTLAAGFQIAQALREPFQRAVFLMFLITEVHPFLDGNGRLARIMMNAELEAGDHHRIIVPTVSRDDYMLPLRRLSRHGDVDPLVRSMARLQTFVSLIPFGNYNSALEALKDANAFELSGEAVLRMP